MRAFLSNLANRQIDRQTDRQTSRAIAIPPPLSEVNYDTNGFPYTHTPASAVPMADEIMRPFLFRPQCSRAAKIGRAAEHRPVARKCQWASGGLCPRHGCIEPPPPLTLRVRGITPGIFLILCAKSCNFVHTYTVLLARNESVDSAVSHWTKCREKYLITWAAVGWRLKPFVDGLSLSQSPAGYGSGITRKGSWTHDSLEIRSSTAKSFKSRHTGVSAERSTEVGMDLCPTLERLVVERQAGV